MKSNKYLGIQWSKREKVMLKRKLSTIAHGVAHTLKDMDFFQNIDFVKFS